MGGAPLERVWPYQDLLAGGLCFPCSMVAAFVLAAGGGGGEGDGGNQGRSPGLQAVSPSSQLLALCLAIPF